MSPLPVRVETNASALPVGEYSGRDSVAGCDTSNRATAGEPPSGAAQISPPDVKAISRPSGEMPGSASSGPVDWPCEVIDGGREQQADQQVACSGCACGEASHKARRHFKPC